MKFDFEGAKYEIEFSRQHRQVVVGAEERTDPVTGEVTTVQVKKPSKYPYTTVVLWRSAVGRLPGELFRTATCGCWFKERLKPNQSLLETGRLRALRMISKTLPVALKREMWRAYMSRPKQDQKGEKKQLTVKEAK